MRQEIAAIWPNYNSSHIIDVAKASLRSLSKQVGNGIDIFLIIVDNASSDGSYEELVDYISNELTINYEIIRTSRNFGYAGAVRLAYETIARKFDFILLLNNDIVLEENTLKEIMSRMQKYDLSAAQGVVMNRKGQIDNAGYMIDEFLLDHPIKCCISSFAEPLFVTYTTGSFTLVNNDSLRKCLTERPIMYSFVQAYLDDNLLGLRLWNCGNKLGTVKVVAGYHLHGATYSKYPYLKIYNRVMSYVVKTRIITTRLKNIIPLIMPKLIMRSFVKNKVLNKVAIEIIIKAIRDGIRYSEAVEERLSLYKGPYVRLSSAEVIYYLVRPYFKVSKENINMSMSKNLENLSIFLNERP